MSAETFRAVITGEAGFVILVMIAGAIALFSLVTKIHAKVEEVVGKLSPILDTTNELVQENRSKFSDIASHAKEITANAKDITDVARDQAHRFADVGRDVADRAKAQVARLDSAMDETVDQVQNAGQNLKSAAMKPVREASGVIAGVKAAVSTYAQGRRASVDHVTQDEEMFI
jgi:methyl-accepting chemotaxis protein